MPGPFATYIDPAGNLYMQEGSVIALNSTTAFFNVGGAGVGVALQDPTTAFMDASKGTGSFQGGAGNNVSADSPVLATFVPDGFFKPEAPDTWVSGDLTMTYDPGTGGAEIGDGTDIVAELPTGSSTVAPYGTFSSTTYGETTYNAGSPFTVATDYEGGDPWGGRGVTLTAAGSTAQGGDYIRTDWQVWESAVDPAWTITLDGTGAGVVSDGTDDVLTRPAAADSLYDATSNLWESTAYGQATYGGDEFFYAETVLGRAFPIAGFLYVTLALDANDEVTGVTGPFFEPAMPSNSSTAVSVPVAYSDGAGTITQIQLGPIVWRPAL